MLAKFSSGLMFFDLSSKDDKLELRVVLLPVSALDESFIRWFFWPCILSDSYTFEEIGEETTH